MNSLHDMGGTMGFGPVEPERDEPPFHAAWEKRAFALTLAMGATGQWNLDMSRAARESLPPLQYLSSSYYEIWLAGLLALLRSRGLVADDELAAGRSLHAARPLARRLAAADVAGVLSRGAPTERTAAAAPRFAVGDAVRARNLHPTAHTRLPRYVRGHAGRVVACRGAHVYPDAHAAGAGEQPQWLYTVSFDAAELWGADTTADAVCVDCFEPYLDAIG